MRTKNFQGVRNYFKFFEANTLKKIQTMNRRTDMEITRALTLLKNDDPKNEIERRVKEFILKFYQNEPDEVDIIEGMPGSNSFRPYVVESEFGLKKKFHKGNRVSQEGKVLINGRRVKRPSIKKRKKNKD